MATHSSTDFTSVVSVIGEEAPPDRTKTAEKYSYAQILESSALIGGSQMMDIGSRMLRTKAIAMILGPAGFGLFGLYGSIVDLAVSVAGLGVNSSGVRQIAEAVGSGDDGRIAQTAVVLRKTSVVLGVIGAAILILFSRQISILTFNDVQHRLGVSLLSLAVLFRLVAAGQAALIQGMRHIADLAKLSVLGSVLGLLISVPVVYVLKERGVVPSLVAAAGTTIITSWWYSRKIQIRFTPFVRSEIRREVASLLKLGSAFMASGLMMMGAAYWIRVLISRELGFAATGLYQSAWNLGGLYVGFILQAMGADFYPRLTAVASDDNSCNRLVNEQARISLLLAGPGVLATITFASIVIAAFYSGKFGPAVHVLRWISLGTMLQVVSWPMGFIILAKGNQKLFFWSELLWTIFYVLVAWLCVKRFGLTGSGIAFFAAYLFHVAMIYTIVRHLSGFRWSRDNVRAAMLLLALISIVFCSLYMLPLALSATLGTIATAFSGFYSIKILLTLIPVDQLPGFLRPMYRGCEQILKVAKLQIR